MDILTKVRTIEEYGGTILYFRSVKYFDNGVVEPEELIDIYHYCNYCFSSEEDSMENYQIADHTSNIDEPIYCYNCKALLDVMPSVCCYEEDLSGFNISKRKAQLDIWTSLNDRSKLPCMNYLLFTFKEYTFELSEIRGILIVAMDMVPEFVGTEEFAVLYNEYIGSMDEEELKEFVINPQFNRWL